MPTPPPRDGAQVGEKDDATEKLLLEMKTDREVLGETLDRASLDLRAKQVPPLHLITSLRPTPHGVWCQARWGGPILSCVDHPRLRHSVR
jgi:hypothetical protein